ncbi:8982_t:CDS:2 [Paraglomus brasilianum]|uniref:8982_t:CDS:1 n=1 Tax=Paraglomus brasilianum TaxID=144538 RepID=A0A9N9FBE7_9GLOM|nr:8982_t:CDS:2 [Paraglomus brasilianum]
MVANIMSGLNVLMYLMAALEWHQMTSTNSIFQKTRSFVTPPNS